MTAMTENSGPTAAERSRNRSKSRVNTSTARIVGFNYTGLSPAEAKVAREAAGRIKICLNTSVIKVGEDLIAVKDTLKHGQYGAWLRAEFGFSERAAQRYMRAARLARKSDMVSDLAPTALYALSAPSTPKSVRKDVVQRLERGERLTSNDISKLIRQKKDDPSDASTVVAAKPKKAAACNRKSGRPIVRFPVAIEAMIRERREPADGKYFWMRVRRKQGRLLICDIRRHSRSGSGDN
jgi:Protein of unknown function (DUF3102)